METRTRVITKEKHRDIIRDNDDIRAALFKAFADQELEYKDVIERAELKGVKIDFGALSKYINGQPKNEHGTVKGGLSQQKVLWLMKEFGIKLEIHIIN